jgi:ferritin
MNQKADKLIKKSARKVAENATSRKSLEIRQEINDLINELVDLEYKENDKNLMKPNPKRLSGEDDFLGFSKFSSPIFQLPNKRTESQRYLETLKDDLNHDLFKSEDYLANHKWEVPAVSQPEKTCKCLNEFYTQHSACN